MTTDPRKLPQIAASCLKSRDYYARVAPCCRRGVADNPARLFAALRVTPAMQLGVTDHVWTLAELLDAALAPVPEERKAVGMPEGLSPSGGRPTLRVLDGGRL